MRISKHTKHDSDRGQAPLFEIGKNVSFFYVGCEIYGLESRVRESGLGLLGWKVGCNYDHFENSPRMGQ